MFKQLRHACALFILLFSHQVLAQADLGGKVYQLFQSKCVECHGPGSKGSGGFDTILDFKSMRDSNFYVIPGNADGSEIYSQVILDFMPEGDDPLTANQKDLIKAWIEAGAPDPEDLKEIEVTKQTLEKKSLEFIKRFSKTDQKFKRIISFVHLNRVFGDKDLYFQALSKILNSLSQNPKVVKPKILPGTGEMAFVIDLRDYKWTVELWEELSLPFPFHSHSIAVSQLIDLTETSTPIIHGEWLIKQVSFEPLYGKLVQHPDSLQKLEENLGIDRIDNIKNFKVERSGFRESGVSHHNRMIERHDIPGRRGAYWISYDFDSSSGEKSLFSNPFLPDSLLSDSANFKHDGGEVIYNLPNGMQAYLLVTAAGEILREAPRQIVEDTDPRRPTIFNGASCFTCHSDGMRRNYDRVKDFVFESDAFSKRQKILVNSLYANREKLEKLFDTDDETYHEAMKEAGVIVTGPEEDPINQFIFLQDEKVRLPYIADVIGVSIEALKAGVEAKFNFELLKFIERAESAEGVSRKKFQEFFPSLARIFRIPVRILDFRREVQLAAQNEQILVAEGVYPAVFIDKAVDLIGSRADRVIFVDSITFRPKAQDQPTIFSNFSLGSSADIIRLAGRAKAVGVIKNGAPYAIK